MRILEINKFNFPNGGADRHFLDLVKLLESSGHEVAVFSMKNKRNLYSCWEKYFVSPVGYGRDYNFQQKVKGLIELFWSFEARRKIKKVLNDFKPEIVHIHNIYHQISPSILGEIKKRKIPVIMTVHDHKLVSPDRERFYPKFNNSYWKFIFKKSYSLPRRILLVVEMYFSKIFNLYDKYIDFYICPSQFLKNNLVAGGIKPEKIAVIEHFISSFPNGRSIPKTEKGDYALYFGRVSKEKGVDKLVEIFNRLKFPLVVVGDIEDDFEIGGKYVKYFSRKTSAELKPIVKNCKFVVSASNLSETFGLLALEANSFGKPFLGLKSGAYPEIIKNGFNGFLTKDLSELELAIRKFIEGEMVLGDGEEIRITADQKFSEEKYLEKFFKAVRLLTEK